MHDNQNVTAWFHSRKKAVLVVAVAALVACAFLVTPVFRGRPSIGITEQERADIAALVRREIPGTVGSMTPKPGGTVQVFVGSGGQLGGQLIQVERHKGTWRVVQRTVLYL